MQQSLLKLKEEIKQDKCIQKLKKKQCKIDAKEDA